MSLPPRKLCEAHDWLTSKVLEDAEAERNVFPEQPGVHVGAEPSR